MEHNALLEGRIKDLSQRTFTDDYLTHTNFLSLSDLSMFYSIHRNMGYSVQMQEFNGVPFQIYGGHPDAERNVICFLPSYITRDNFISSEFSSGNIIKCIHVTPLNSKFADDLTHRDFLGALMNMGIEREMIGDILIDGNCAYVFVISDIADIISDELCRIKNTSVSCITVTPSSCNITPKFTHVSGSVASCRLDAIVAMVYHMSRSKSQDYIKAEKVFVDGRIISDSGYILKPGDRVSVRSKGKFIFSSVGAITKKGRFYAEIDLYS